MYYLRTKPAANANQVTVDKTKLNRSTNTTGNGDVAYGVNTEGRMEDVFNMNAMVCSLENKDECLMCGS
jgi:ribonucleoside-diphosphate reductase subunit M1